MVAIEIVFQCTAGMMETVGPNVLIPVQQATQAIARSHHRKSNKVETSGEGGGGGGTKPTTARV